MVRRVALLLPTVCSLPTISTRGLFDNDNNNNNNNKNKHQY